jgi:hypothetical protein
MPRPQFDFGALLLDRPAWQAGNQTLDTHTPAETLATSMSASNASVIETSIWNCINRSPKV